MYRNFFKRLFDIIISAAALLVFSPVILVTVIVLLFINKGRPFFFQDRPGMNEEKIKVIKFKSMTDERDANGQLLPDKQRMTGFGNFIRKTSIDELLQFVNVLKGDMSIIGPRPLLYKYLPLYSERQKLRHTVRPGITGWAQVNGRNSISWQQKFELDVYYVEHLSLMLDIKILLLTVKKVLVSEGIDQSQDRPMTPFNGHN